jgi:hypothetical protein
MGSWRAAYTVALVDIRGTPVVAWTRATTHERWAKQEEEEVPKKKQISAQLDKEEVGYMQRKSPALSMWYLPVIDRLWAIFGSPEDAKLMS